MLLFNWLSAVQAVLQRSLRSRRRRTSSAFGERANVAAMVERLESRQLLTHAILIPTPIVVTIGGDTHVGGQTTLREAIAYANADGSGATIAFADSLAGQTITLTQGELLITGSMTITGLGASQLTIDGNNTSRIFEISNARSTPIVTITGLTLQHGNGVGTHSGYGGAIDNAGVLTLASSEISGNFSNQGGGIFNQGTLTSTNDTISGNSSGAQGGGIRNTGTMTSTNDTIAGNSVTYSGGGIENEGTLIATNDTISGNSSSEGGGILNFGLVTATNVTIAGNSATLAGGGIVNIDNSGSVTAINSIIVGNTATSGGDVLGTLSPSSINNLVGIPVGMTLSSILQTDVGGKPLLANNGGPTQTIALANNVSNPALGTGVALATIGASGDGGLTLTVDSTTFLAVGDKLKIGTEIVTVTAVTGNTLTVLRGQSGTTQANLNGLAVTLAFDQRSSGRNANADLGAFETSTPTVRIVDNGGVYTAVAFAVTDATVTGVSNQTIASFGDASLSYTYYAGTLAAADLAGATPLSGAPINAGNYTVVARYTSNLVGYRNSTSMPDHFAITPAVLTISAVTNTKAYDGTKSANAIPTVSGLKGTDIVSGLTEHYTQYSALGTNNSALRVDSGYSIADGNGGANYTVVVPFAFGTITPAALTIAPASQTKVFDGTTNASGKLIVLSGLIPGDTVTGTTAYASRNVMGLNGSTLLVSSFAIADGNGGGNYIVTEQTSAGTIAPVTLTIAAVTNTRVYNGTKSAAATPIVTGLITGDTVTGLTEHYTQYSALGTNNSVLRVDPGYLVNDGNGGANYKVVLPFAFGTITPAVLTINAVTFTKVFDGTTSANAKPIVTGLIAGDVVTNLTEHFMSPRVRGVNRSTLKVDAGFTIVDGNGGGNYIVTINSATGTITRAN